MRKGEAFYFRAAAVSSLDRRGRKKITTIMGGKFL